MKRPVILLVCLSVFLCGSGLLFAQEQQADHQQTSSGSPQLRLPMSLLFLSIHMAVQAIGAPRQRTARCLQSHCGSLP